jgi:hypothetical protein
VVGRVNIGMDVLQLLDDVPRAPDDSPLMRIKVSCSIGIRPWYVNGCCSMHTCLV